MKKQLIELEERKIFQKREEILWSKSMHEQNMSLVRGNQMKRKLEDKNQIS